VRAAPTRKNEKGSQIAMTECRPPSEIGLRKRLGDSAVQMMTFTHNDDGYLSQSASTVRNSRRRLRERRREKTRHDNNYCRYMYTVYYIGIPVDVLSVRTRSRKCTAVLYYYVAVRWRRR